MSAPWRKPIAVGVVLGAICAARAPGGEASAANEPAINLPPMIVEETDRALQWRYVARPGFEVLSVCDDATTVRFIERQMRLAELLQVILPDRFQVHLAVPEAQVLFNEETGRAHSREIVAEMVRKAGARLSTDGVVQSEDPTNPLRTGLPRPRIQFLPNMRLADLDAVRVFTILDPAGTRRMDFMFAIDRVAFLLARRTPALPDWFMVGLLGVYGRLGVGEDDLEFRPFVWLSEEESAALARDLDRPRGLLPMRELLTQRPVGEDGSPTETAATWKAQCALFVRWALTDPTGQRREALWRWLDYLDTGAPTEEAFLACFGCGFADMRDRLSDYLPTAVRASVTLKGPKPGARPPLKPRPATDGEVARIRGDWERLEIAQVRQRYPALVDRYVEQARRTLHRAYDRGERDVRLLAGLGLTECDAGNPAAGRDFLEAAVRGGVVWPRVWLEAARLRFQSISASDPNHRFTAAETEEVVSLLREAHRMAPPLAEIYVLAGRVWLQSASAPVPADLAMMSEGVRLFPSVPGIVLSAIKLHLASGAAEPAAAFARAGWQHVRDPAARERFARLQVELAAAK